MFNNPLKKYQQGGQVSQEQQKVLAAFIQWLPKRVKEFQNMEPDQIIEALNGMSKTAEGQKQVQSYMEQFQQELQSSNGKMFKEGGKLFDFICKHAKGGHVAGCGCKEDGGKVEKNQNGKIINSKTRTIAQVNDGISKWQAEELGIDPNMLSGTGVTITAYPNRKPYAVDGMLPFFKRNGIAFQSGGSESSSVEDGARLGRPAIAGRKYKVSTIGGQDYYGNPEAIRYPVITRYASPKDTIYNLGFQTYGANSPAYSGIRDMYNSAIQQPNTFAWDKDSYVELQRQKNENKKDGGKVEKHASGKPIRNGNYEVTVNAPGDTTRTFYNKYNRQVMQTYPDGSVRYTTMSNNGGDDYQINSWMGTPNAWRRLWYGNRQATPEKVQAWNEEIANQPLDPRNQKKENGGVVKGQSGLAKIGKAVVNTAKSARKTGAYVPEQAIGKPFFTNTVKISNSISPERYKAVINWRLANDPNYKLSLDSMERAMQTMGNTDVAYDLYRLKNFGATNKAEFLQFEDMMNRGLTGNQVVNSLKVRPGNNGIFPLDLGSGHYAKEAEQMVLHPYVSGIGNFKKGGVVNNNKPTWINRIKK